MTNPPKKEIGCKYGCRLDNCEECNPTKKETPCRKECKWECYTSKTVHDCDCHWPIGKESPKNDLNLSDWSSDFDLLMRDCRVVHVYETEQFKKIKEFCREQIQAAYQRGFNRACMLYQQPPFSYEKGKQEVEIVEGNSPSFAIKYGEREYERGKREERERILAALPKDNIIPKDSGETRVEASLYGFMQGWNGALSKVRAALEGAKMNNG